MQSAWSLSARSLLERALAIAAERRTPATTLHLVAAVFDSPSDLTRVFRARGVRTLDLRSGARVHPEAVGTLDRVQARARKLAEARGVELTGVHLVSAALTEPHTAAGALLAQLGCDPLVVAHEVLREPPVAARPAVIQRAASAPPVAASPAPLRPTLRSPPRDPLGAPIRTARLSPLDTRAVAAATAMPAATPPVTTSPRPVTPSPRPVPPREGGTPRTLRNRDARVTVRPGGGLDARSFPVLAALHHAAPGDTPGDAPGAAGLLGRGRELERLRDALGRREGRGALVVGAAGAGKSAVVRALGAGPGAVLVVLSHADLVARMRGPQGEKVRGLCDELARAAEGAPGGVPGLTVALDPLAPWFTSRDAPEDVVLELRALLSGGTLPWVGTATPEEARKLGEVEPWIERTAVRVELEELPHPVVRAIVTGHAGALGAHHRVTVTEAVAARAVELCDRYLAGRAQPERTLAVLDLALSRARRQGAGELGAGTVAAVVAELGGLPPERVAETDAERLLALEAHLARRVVGHPDALARIARVLRRNAVGFRGARPIGTFLLLGPTGVGKTETAKAIAEVLYPGAGALTRFDMGEYAEAHSVARLVGAPPGYVGYTDGGQLTEAARRRPYQLILLDEIEKAHRDVLESLLALLDEGRMTDGRGRTVDFRHTVVVMTSNLGADLYREGLAAAGRSIGFGTAQAPVRAPGKAPGGITEAVLAAAREALPPELWNRIDEPLVYGPLDRVEVAEVARRLLADTCSRLRAEQGIEASATARVVDLLLDQGGYEPALGARPMRRAIARLVEAPLAEAVLRGTFRRGDGLVVDAREGMVTLERAGAT